MIFLFLSIFLLFLKKRTNNFPRIIYGYLRKLFFDAEVKKYVRNQGETKEPSGSASLTTAPLLSD